MATASMKAVKRILVVDDEPATTKVVRKRLTSHGYAVMEAHNGMEAIELAKKEQPDLIIMDILMPGLNGSDTATRLRQDKRTTHIPLIFLTCLAESLDVDRTGLTPNGYWILPKPYRSAQLLTLVERIIEQELSGGTLFP